LIGGYVADVTVLTLFAQGDGAAMAEVDEIDADAQGLLVPMAALIEAHRAARSAQETEYLGQLMGIGVVIAGEMTTGVAAAGIEVVSMAPSAPLLTAEACAHARLRGWPVLATDPQPYQNACPDVRVATLRNR
jgi:hypothetical protein